jgi:hypothetical protein
MSFSISQKFLFDLNFIFPACAKIEPRPKDYLLGIKVESVSLPKNICYFTEVFFDFRFNFIFTFFTFIPRFRESGTTILLIFIIGLATALAKS